MYNMDTKLPVMKWLKEIDTKVNTKILTFTMSSALFTSDGKTYAMGNNTLGYAVMDRNSVESNTQAVYLLPRKSKAHIATYAITDINFDRCLGIFASRRLIEANWINWQDEYMVPCESSEYYTQYINDAIVYSVFNNKSNMSSLRHMTEQGITQDIQNEFFWVSVKEIANLAGGLYSKDDINTAIEDDIEAFGKERFVYKKLQIVTLSPDAQAVLDKATELLKSSFKYRKQLTKHTQSII